MFRRTGGVVGIEQRLDGTCAFQRASDAGGDLVAGHVGEFLVHEDRRVGVTPADETRVKPLLGDALELAEEMETRRFAGVAPFGVEQALGDVEEKRRGAQVSEVFQIHVHALPDDASVARD